MGRSIRVRLALWYGGVLAASLAAFAAIVFVYVSRSTDRRIDESLQNVAHAFVAVWTGAQTANPSRVLSPDQIVGDFRADEFELVIFDESQREIASNSMTSRLPARRSASADDGPRAKQRPDIASLFREAGARGEAFATVDGPSGPERAYAVSIALAGRRQVVAVLQDLASRRELLTDLSEVLLVLAPIALVLAFGGGLFLAGRALRPVADMARQADRIEAASLHERLPIGNPDDELGFLAGVMNRLLGRLDSAFDQQRRFLSEAAHELRSPVAVVRGEADLALSRTERPQAEYREALTAILDESRRITRIVDDLFLLGRSDAAGYPISHTAFDLAALVRGFAEQASRQRAGGGPVQCDAPGPLPIQGDESLLGRCIRNLIDNAIKYGREGGTIRVEAARRGDRYVVSVRDDGPGIPAGEQNRIFERFFRGSNAWSAVATDGGSGAGLGLAISRWIAEAHQGRLELAKSDASGSTFELTLPAPDEA